MKRFMFFSIGVLCLMLSALIGFHIGGRQARAQGPGVVLVGSGGDHPIWVMTETGDVYTSSPNLGGVGDWFFERPADFVGNFWTGDGAVATQESTIGEIKSKYDSD